MLESVSARHIQRCEGHGKCLTVRFFSSGYLSCLITTSKHLCQEKTAIFKCYFIWNGGSQNKLRQETWKIQMGSKTFCSFFWKQWRKSTPESVKKQWNLQFLIPSGRGCMKFPEVMLWHTSTELKTQWTHRTSNISQCGAKWITQAKGLGLCYPKLRSSQRFHTSNTQQNRPRKMAQIPQKLSGLCGLWQSLLSSRFLSVRCPFLQELNKSTICFWSSTPASGLKCLLPTLVVQSYPII